MTASGSANETVRSVAAAVNSVRTNDSRSTSRWRAVTLADRSRTTRRLSVRSASVWFAAARRLPPSAFPRRWTRSAWRRSSRANRRARTSLPFSRAVR
ncbi:hypothetical protein ACFQJ6_01870 [Halorussus caseinilyticus]|uniref:Uncharacterized protein n=1 Tax=Halorussus caseinilyticus TaxID=3034025 RepID=A0ABD5WIV5_9EURY